MRLAQRTRLTTGAFANTYTNDRAKGDRPQSWAWANKRKRKPGACVSVPISTYLKEHT